MTIDSQPAPAPPSSPPSRAAQIISEIAGPLPLGVLTCVGVGAATSGLGGLGWGLVAIAFAAGLPYVVTWRMRHPATGQPSRNTRLAYLGIALACATVGLIIVGVLGAPHRIVAVTATMLIGLVVSIIANAAIRASNHVAAASGATVLLTVLYGPAFLAGYLVVGLVGWSRLTLRRHTIPELITGTVVGSVVSAVALPLLLR